MYGLIPVRKLTTLLKLHWFKNTTAHIDSIMNTLENYINIRKIKEHYPELIPDNFHFNLVTTD